MQLVVGAAVVDDLRRPRTLLAARRTAPPALAGGWELPGGKVEPGEAPLDALRRELAEELGVDIEIGAEVVAEGAAGWELTSSTIMRVWMVRITRGDPAPLQDHDELRVLPLGHWRDVAWLPGDVPVIEALIGRVNPNRVNSYEGPNGWLGRWLARVTGVGDWHGWLGR